MISVKIAFFFAGLLLIQCQSHKTETMKREQFIEIEDNIQLWVETFVSISSMAR